MDKKDFKFYVTPSQEIIETELQGFLCGSNVDNIDPSNDEEL